MRAFLAVDVDEGLVNEIMEVQKKLSEAEAPVKFVEPENLHFTFKFFGEISENRKKQIVDMLEYKVQKYESFPISIKGMGVFPNLGYIRVVWLGVEDSENFSHMLQAFDQEFVDMGFKKERSYIPHLTIGRVKGAQNKEALVSIIQEMEKVEIGDMQVRRLVLKESELTPAGPIYNDLKVFEL